MPTLNAQGPSTDMMFLCEVDKSAATWYIFRPEGALQHSSGQRPENVDALSNVALKGQRRRIRSDRSESAASPFQGFGVSPDRISGRCPELWPRWPFGPIGQE